MKKSDKLFTGILYWLIQLTWGILMTVIGLIVSFVCILFFKGKIHKNGFSYIVEVGGDWGGLSLGAVSFCGSYSLKSSPYYDIEWYERTRRHEFGHSLQNLVFGPLFPFIVAIPSAFRYWYFTIAESKGKSFPEDAYDSIWFEKEATIQGKKAIDYIEGQQ